MPSDKVASLASFLAAGYVRLVGLTSHWDIRGEEPVRELFRDGRHIIFAFWHNRFIMMPYCYRHHFRKERIAVIVSQSRDGELVGKFLDRYRFKSIRGSSSRGGRKAMLALLRLLKEDWDAAITPDGPRGPRYQVQDGIITLASMAGLPIVPASYASSLRIVFRKSWDHFRLPLPGSRIRLVFAEPLTAGRNMNDMERDNLRKELRRRLRWADRQAEAVVSEEA